MSSFIESKENKINDLSNINHKLNGEIEEISQSVNKLKDDCTHHHKLYLRSTKTIDDLNNLINDKNETIEEEQTKVKNHVQEINEIS